MSDKKDKKSKKPDTGLEIIKASYGVTPNFVDVTEPVKDMMKGGELDFTVSAQGLGILSPAPGVVNTLQIQFKTNGGRVQNLTVDDNQPVLLSAPPLDDDPPVFNPAYEFLLVLFYFVLAICITYFGMSGFRLGKEGFGSDIIAYLLAILAGGSFIAFGTSGAATGIMALLFSSPALIAVIPITVFLYSLYNPAGIDFSYALKQTTDAAAAIVKPVAETVVAVATPVVKAGVPAL